jgi:hypothetical protein
MAQLTKSGFESQAVVWSGCALSSIALPWMNQTGYLFALGITLTLFGLVQSYWGSLTEFPEKPRTYWYVMGVLLTMFMGITVTTTIRDYLPGPLSMLLLMLIAFAIQLAIIAIAKACWAKRASLN